MHMKRFIITGKRGIGKSELLRNIIKECKLDFEGFTTFFDHTKNRLYLQINNKERYLIAERNKHGYMQSNIDELLKAAKAIDGLLTSQKSLIIDELGYIEQESPEFMEVIEAALRNAKKCLCVIRKDNNPFLKRIKQLPDYEIITLTSNNREVVRRKLIYAICNKTGNNSRPYYD
ncbi:MAG: AAA family ATPase [Kosmotoga sp.]|nr:MAG: AAA family ATPase [Kosmotoga sp.]